MRSVEILSSTSGQQHNSASSSLAPTPSARITPSREEKYGHLQVERLFYDKGWLAAVGPMGRKQGGLDPSGLISSRAWADLENRTWISTTERADRMRQVPLAKCGQRIPLERSWMPAAAASKKPHCRPSTPPPFRLCFSFFLFRCRFTGRVEGRGGRAS